GCAADTNPNATAIGGPTTAGRRRTAAADPGNVLRLSGGRIHNARALESLARLATGTDLTPIVWPIGLRFGDGPEIRNGSGVSRDGAGTIASSVVPPPARARLREFAAARQPIHHAELREMNAVVERSGDVDDLREDAVAAPPADVVLGQKRHERPSAGFKCS